jgi:acetoacetate decarboxylase
VLPEGIEPFAEDPGRCAALFVDWQSCSEGGDELVDPARGQYKEFFVVVAGSLDGEAVTTCPYIWVDRDFALVRGWIQGFPKKLGQIEMTRSFGLDCLAEGGRLPACAPRTGVCSRGDGHARARVRDGPDAQ